MAVLLAMASGCCKKGEDGSPGGDCPGKYSSLPASQKTGGATCKCGPLKAIEPVWGSDIYTTDSSVCGAAVHAGVIPASGGEVTFKGAPGCETYAGTARNGVPSGSWGSYEGSFFFPGKGDGKCAATPSGAPTAAGRPTGSGTACPANFKSVAGLNANSEISCRCNAGAPGGSVWGSDIYTQDSSICAAALHAGEVLAGGGMVKAKAAPGCKSYAGTTRNGVTSSAWGSFEASFYFPAKGTGTCGK